MLVMFSPDVDEIGSLSTPLSKQLQPWFVAVLVLEAVALCGRLCWDDCGGTVLMVLVVLLGLVTTLRKDGVHVIYCRYYGLVAFASGTLDVGFALEMLGRRLSHWHPHQLLTVFSLSVLLQVICGCTQFLSAAMCHIVVKDAEAGEEEESILVIQQEAYEYGASMRRLVLDQRTQPSGVKPFGGEAHKLP